MLVCGHRSSLSSLLCVFACPSSVPSPFFHKKENQVPVAIAQHRPLTETPLRTLAAAEAVDLHLHTLASDGFWTPFELVDYLADHDFRVAAICDHDTQASVLAAIRQGERRGVLIVPGIEVTSRWHDRQWHLLVYGIRPDDERPEAQSFLEMVTTTDTAYREMARDARQRVEASGRPLPSLSMSLNADAMYPVHVLRAMIAEKHVPRLKEAAELVVELGGNFTIDRPLPEVVERAHQAGGICILAHPGRADLGPALTGEVLDEMLKEVALDGIETHYRSYTDTETAFYRDLAEQRGLMTSTGSDSHALGAPVDPRPWQAIWAATLLARLGVEVEPRESGPVWEPGMDPLVVKPAPPKEELTDSGESASPSS
jgi:predicted metal-dependent phosphoesterase TrpH